MWQWMSFGSYMAWWTLGHILKGTGRSEAMSAADGS